MTNHPQKWRKRPVEIDAMQWLPDNHGGQAGNRLADWLNEHDADWSTEGVGTECVIKLTTLEGVMSVPHGHWVIRGVAGEFYPCRPDIFATTYELVHPNGD